MIYFLYGQNTYGLRQKLKEIIDEHKKIRKSGLGLRYIDLEEKRESSSFAQVAIDALKSETETMSMFEDKKLIILRNVLNELKGEEKFLDLVKKVKDSDDLIVFCEESEPDQRTSLFKFLKKYAKCQQINFLGGERLRKWIKDEFLRLKSGIEDRALEKLVLFAGNDPWSLENEIQKLVNFKAGKRIEEKDIDILVKPKIENDIFKTIDAMAVKNKKLAISLIHEHLQEGESPLYILSMINYQFRNLLVIKDLVEKGRQYQSIAKITKLHPFVISKSWDQVRRFSLAELKKIYQKIFEVDLAIKTGKIDPKTALDLFIAEI